MKRCHTSKKPAVFASAAKKSRKFFRQINPLIYNHLNVEMIVVYLSAAGVGGIVEPISPVEGEFK
jgi:cell division septation protein DedD